MDVGAILTSSISTINLQRTQFEGNGEIQVMHETASSGGKEATLDEINKAVDILNKTAGRVDDRISFDYNEETKRIIVRIMDPQTKEVVRQFPSEEMIRVLENIHEMLGLFIDTKR